MLTDLKSKWFRAYCRAVTEGEPQAARVYVRDAFIEINSRMHDPDLSDSERETLSVASRYLNQILKVELTNAA